MAREQNQDQRQKPMTKQQVADQYKFQPHGDYSKGHPGVPPRDYKPPEEKKGFLR
jgi:hypothetical protein